MMRMERRQTPRMPVEGLAYVNLEPDNGGIVLNISEGGLCFHSTASVQQTTTIRFWFSQRNSQVEADDRLPWTDETQKRGGSRSIEADSELAWTDKTRKIGGLRFTNLPAGAREEIRNWISQHAAPVTVDEKSAPSLPSSRRSPSLSANGPDTTAARRSSTTLEVLSPDIQPPRRLTGFSGGLLAGVLVSVLVATVFLLRTHSREFGDSLVHFGQRLGGSSSPQPASPKPQPVSHEPYTVSPAEIPVPQPERLVAQSPQAAVKPHEVKPAAETPAAAVALPAPKAKASGAAAPSSPNPAPPSVPTMALAPTSDPNSSILRATVPQPELAKPPDVYIEHSKEVDTGPPPERYLEVGKFNDRLLADITTDKLSRFGFPVKVIHKSLFWRKSYQILVGPYGSDHEAEAAHKNLTSRGFSPRSFERGTRGFTLHSALRLDGKRIPVGDYVITWESYPPDAIVKFEGYEVVLTVEGKWVRRGVRYDEDAIVYKRNVDGSRSLNEIRFSGMEHALVFSRGNI
jgi:hypothetical protein